MLKWNILNLITTHINKYEYNTIMIIVFITNKNLILCKQKQSYNNIKTDNLFSTWIVYIKHKSWKWQL